MSGNLWGARARMNRNPPVHLGISGHLRRRLTGGVISGDPKKNLLKFLHTVYLRIIPERDNYRVCGKTTIYGFSRDRSA
jgi:hypothetical protein